MNIDELRVDDEVLFFDGRYAREGTVQATRRIIPWGNGSALLQFTKEEQSYDFLRWVSGGRIVRKL